MFYFKIIINSHAIVRNNSESLVHSTVFPPMAKLKK